MLAHRLKLFIPATFNGLCALTVTVISVANRIDSAAQIKVTGWFKP